MKKVGIYLVAAAALLCSGQQAFAAYADYIAGTNPVGWWGMNEETGAGATADLSGAYGAANNQAGVNLNETYQNPGVNTLPAQAGFVSGAGNASTYFDGTAASNAYAHATGAYSSALPGAIYHYDGGFSVECWVKTDGIASVDSERFLGVREWALGFEANYGSPNRIHFTTFGKQDYFSTTVFPNDGQWHQIGVSWDGSTASFFIDGVAAGSQAGAVGLTPASPTSINNQMDLASRASTSSQNFKGWLDEVVIWNATRDEAAFAASYAAAIPEPATVSLLVLGGLGALLRRRRA
ncbi:MAG: PEP-CTERM sorting domain-containing protein [Planctomycetota bacterium]|nr:PEP-CTERM sorting domain-containing protein [Planctomycetota bacterium]